MKQWLFRLSIVALFPILSSQFTELLGESKHAKVWGSPEHDYVIKIGRGSEANQQEFEMLTRVYQTLEKSDPDLMKRASVVKPLKDDPLLTERIFSPKSLYLRKKYARIEKTVNGYPRMGSSRTNMEQLCYDLGKLVAIVQLRAKIDGEDFEFFLGRESRDGKGYKIFLLDLEKAKDVSSYFAERQMEPLIDVFNRALQEKRYAYFPAPSTEGFIHFKQGYLDVAAQEDATFCLPLAHQLFDRFLSGSQ